MKGTRLHAWIGAALVAAAVHLSASSAPAPIFTFETGGYGDYAVALAVDAQGNSVVIGSRPYPTGPFPVTDDAVEKSARSMFVAKVDARGDRLVWATYLGGVHNRNSYSRGPLDYPTAVAVDFAGNVFAAGYTSANDFPTINAIVAMPGGAGSDGFLTKISADGKRYIFSTYFGGALPTAVATDPIGNVYVALASTTRLAFETRDLSAPGALGASVVAKFNAEGGLVFATRFGGGGTKIAHVAVDGAGAVIAAGDGGDNSRWFVNPITTNCWQYPSGQCANPFVVRLDPSGTRMLFASLLGGTTQQSTLTAMALDPAGAIYLLGSTKATDFPVVRGAMQPSNAGGADYFLAKITAAGRLEASTYIGSRSDEPGGPSFPLLTVDLAGRPTIIGAGGSKSPIVAGMDHPDVPLYASRDDGATWARADAGLQTSVYTVAVSAQDRTAYAGTADGVYRSADDGASWRPAFTGIGPDYNGALNVSQLAIDPAHPGTVYAGTSSGLYRSDDRGDTWTRVDGEPFFRGGGVQAQVVVDGNGWVYLGTLGIRRSRDGGVTWTNISTGLTVGPTGRYESVNTIVFDPDAAGTIYTIQNNRLYRTTDAGETWIDQGALSPVGYESIAIPPGRPRRVFASSWDKVYRSNQGIGVWTPLDVVIARAHFAIDPQRPDTLFVSDGWTGGSIAVSRDAGETWRRLSPPIASAPVVDPLRPSSLFLPGAVRSLPFFLQLDETLATVRYASFTDAPLPRAAVVDAAGSIYLLPGGDELVVQKVQPPQILNPSRKGSR